MDAIKAAKARREALMAQVKKIDDWLVMAEEFQAEAAATPPQSLREQLQTRLAAPRGAVKSAVLEAVSEHLMLYGPTSSKDLLAMLVSKGIDPSPNSKLDKVINLSSLLSSEKQFENDRSLKLWSLTPPSKLEGVDPLS